MDGDDLRDLPLSMRKANLARLLRGRPDGIFVSDFEQGEIGPEKAWFQSIAIDHIAAVVRNTGSKIRTGSTRRCIA
jgi:hypothetical protein